jgi:hypothetical protein
MMMTVRGARHRSRMHHAYAYQLVVNMTRAQRINDVIPVFHMTKHSAPAQIAIHGT